MSRNAREMAISIRTRRLGLPIGDTLFGKTCLVVGYGNIAKELIPRYDKF
jgi:phosphoglycerate dehydrogenase-like enzyme